MEDFVQNINHQFYNYALQYDTTNAVKTMQSHYFDQQYMKNLN